MKMVSLGKLVACAACLMATNLAIAGPVVLNEINYHPPDDQESLQWIELHNFSKDPVDLAGWKISKGVDLQFAAGTTLPGGGYAVVVRNRTAFNARYGTNALILGEFTGRLKQGGERLELQDAKGAVADTVKFADRDPWPLAPDGFGATLERVQAAGPGDEPANWAPSGWGSARVGGGTPGRANDSAAVAVPSQVRDVKWSRWVRGTTNRIEWKMSAGAQVPAVTVKYQVVGPKGPEAERLLAPQTGVPPGGDVWTATLPPVADQTVVRFWFEMRDSGGRVTRWPSTNEVRPALSYLSWKAPVRGTIGQLHVWDGGRVESSGQMGRFGPVRKTISGAPKAHGTGTAIYLPAVDAGAAAPPELRDYLRIGSRKGGWKVRFHKDAPLAEMRTVNVIFEEKARFVLSEHLSYEVFRHSKVMAPKSEMVRWVHNGQSEGYHLMFEQPNAGLIARHKRDSSGNLYKLLWYGQGLVGQHEKKNNPTTGHVDLKAAVQGLSGKRGADAWDFIQQNFAIESCVDYFVVNQCIQNWDGYFNNYFAYHGPGAKGRWELIPWDEDKTWGDYDGASARYDWYTMPITYGMIGDQPPSGGGNWAGGGFGPGMWWRPGGWFSGPLLAQPDFRKVYLKRLKEFVETEFTEAKLRAVIDDLEKRLEPEIRHRAEVRGSTEESLLRQFRADMESFRRQVTGRRTFLLKELAK